MCLISEKYLRKHIAKQDIKVEKLLYYNDEYLLSPIYCRKYSIGEIAIGPKPCVKKYFMFNNKYFTYYIKESFHSYKSIIVLKDNFKHYTCNNSKNLDDFIIIITSTFRPVIAECTIPKGSVYYTNKGAYASEMLKINNIKEIKI